MGSSPKSHPPRDGYFAHTKPVAPSNVARFVPNPRSDPLYREVDGEPLGLILDMSRAAAPPLPVSQQTLVDEVRANIGGEEGILAAAELECVLRESLYDFTLTPSHHLAIIRALARKHQVVIPKDPR